VDAAAKKRAFSVNYTLRDEGVVETGSWTVPSLLSRLSLLLGLTNNGGSLMRFDSRSLWFVVFALLGLMIHASSGQSPRLRRQPTNIGPQWEYKVVAFRANAVANDTTVLNAMAGEGWEYAGLIHPGDSGSNITLSSVAFRRLRDSFPAEYRR
jgi:hypothetical protein